MPEKDLITLISLDDAAEVTTIRAKLETRGISCFVKSPRKKTPKSPGRKPVDIRVYMKDLDEALKLIADENKEPNEIPDPET